MGDWLEQYGEGIYETRARPEAWTENWHLTYSKDQKTHYAFRSITTNLQPRIFLKEIHADEKSVITDLATNQSLTIHGTGENAYIASSEVHQPELGAVGIRISTH